MSWSIAPTANLPDDADAWAYIQAVEAADGQALEAGVRTAINTFVKGCKADGIWPAIKASCILAGARTLAGALVPLRGAAPTNFNFVAGDYNRKTGLVGDGSTKYLRLNRAINEEPQNSRHLAVFPTSLAGMTSIRTGITTTLADNGSAVYHTSTGNMSCQLSGPDRPIGRPWTAGALVGASRSSSAEIVARTNSANSTHANTSVTPASNTHFMYSDSTGYYSLCRFAFYSIGESLDLALLDARVTTLINTLASVIP